MTRNVTRLVVGARRGLPSSELPVIVVQGSSPGPTVVVTANLHGDECTGLGVVHALDGWLTDVPLRGTVVMYPSVNPQGLAAGSRLVPADEADLNRAFPGDARGTMSQRVAACLWRDISARDPALVIDLHADSASALPYVIVDRPVRRIGGARRRLAALLLDAADATGLTVLREYPDDAYVQFGLDGSLAGAVVNRLGKPAVTVEVGPRRYLNPEAVSVTLQATLGILAHLDMVDHTTPAHPTRVEGIWRRASSPRAQKAGVLRPVCNPGDGFRKGEPLATIRGLAGQILETIRAQSAGVVVSWVEGCWIPSGGVLGTLAIRDREAL